MVDRTEDRRRATRVKYDGPVIVKHDYTQVLSDASDLSTSGMSVRWPRRLLETSRLGVVFTLPGIGRLDLEGLLVHQASARLGFLAGIEFIEVPFMAGRMIEDYVFDQLIIPV